MNLQNLQRHQSGTALVVVIILLALMCALMLWSVHSLGSLRKEIRLIEEKQAKRFQRMAGEGRQQ